MLSSVAHGLLSNPKQRESEVAVERGLNLFSDFDVDRQRVVSLAEPACVRPKRRRKSKSLQRRWVKVGTHRPELTGHAHQFVPEPIASIRLVLGHLEMQAVQILNRTVVNLSCQSLALLLATLCEKAAGRLGGNATLLLSSEPIPQPSCYAYKSEEYCQNPN